MFSPNYLSSSISSSSSGGSGNPVLQNQFHDFKVKFEKRMNFLYVDKPTPIHRLPNLSSQLKTNLYIKREDHSLYLCNGGNKCRKLEYIMADVKKKNCDTIITCGAVQSNHCMLTSSAAAKEGLECWIVLEERIPQSYSEDAGGNNFLYKLLDSNKVVVAKGDAAKQMEILSMKLTKQGKKPYIIPGGGSYPIGTKAYIDCLQEIKAYSENQTAFDYIFVCSGSGGTHTGLHLGCLLYHYPSQVIGISTNLSKEQQTNRIYQHLQKTVSHFNYNVKVNKEDIHIYDDYVGDGYSIPTTGMNHAIKLFAHQEGILLDPVYTGKCADGMIDLISNNPTFRNKKILFIHTGGATSLFHYKPLNV